MNGLTFFVDLIVNSALASLHRGKTMNYANEAMPMTASEASITSPTESSLMRLDGMLDNVEGTVSLLEQRLAPILSSGMKGENSAKPKAVGASPVVDNILRAGDRAVSIDERLHQLIDRLTV